MATVVEQTITDTIARFERDLGLTSQEIAAALGISLRTLERWRKGESLPQREGRQRLDELLSLHNHVLDLFEENGGAQWLRAQNRYLKGLTPAEMIRLGHFDRVEGAIGVIEHGIFQ